MVDIAGGIMIVDEKMLRINRYRETLLRFWASMQDLDYEVVVNHYLGKDIGDNWTNKLFMNVETATHFLESSDTNNKSDKEK